MNFNALVLSAVLYCHVCNGGSQKRKRKSHKKMEGYILKGVEIEIEQFPWLAQILLMDNEHCGGVIVSDRVILTASHCLDINLLEFLTVHLGSRYLGKGSVYKVCDSYRHPKYNQTSDYPYFYDIGLMLLSKQIKFNRRIQKARIIPTDEDFKEEHFTMAVAGWGLTSSNGNPSKVLKMTRMRYVNSQRCNKTQTNDGSPMPVPNHMFCLVADKWTSDCFGDSGSGVMWGNYVVGIVVTGRDAACGSETMPSMYSDLDYFRDWIKKHVAILEKKSTAKCKHRKKLSGKKESFGNDRKHNEIIHDTGKDLQYNWLGIGVMPRTAWAELKKLSVT